MKEISPPLQKSESAGMDRPLIGLSPLGKISRLSPHPDHFLGFLK
jgi:hypothetical protein